MSFKDKDHFSGHAACYQQFRPNYPDALFTYLAALCPAHELAWDCATGNGQAAVALAPHFERVIATDASAQQIDQAGPHPNVEYLVAPADKAPINDGIVDLVTVAQALHWFDVKSFYAEVNRSLKSGGVLAVWCYQLHSINPEIDSIVTQLYSGIVGPYWPPERKIVEDGYKSLPYRSTNLPRPNSGWFIPGTSSIFWVTSAHGRQLSVIESSTEPIRSRSSRMTSKRLGVIPTKRAT